MMQWGESPESKGQPGVTQAALFASCPCCGERTLWEGAATFARACRSCGQEFAVHEPKGRGLFIVFLPVTVILVMAALWIDEWLGPPLLVQAGFWLVSVPAAIIIALRFAKAAVLVAAVRGRAKE